MHIVFIILKGVLVHVEITGKCDMRKYVKRRGTSLEPTKCIYHQCRICALYSGFLYLKILGSELFFRVIWMGFEDIYILAQAFGHPCLAQHHPLSLTSCIFGGNMLDKLKFSEGPFLKQE
ncbi:hypothetical protein CMV_029761 [Castanea mollissima]|uniref:Uncharacterized protein n=1 Tax=Castanea mollissima TaxID=60419 RepID=A0A8J4V731_9ROSI|nr:hypothetical protein CMV_029761 [Castanea mollissima]